jgi:Clp amino terminal domain, pathogenicity island component/TIR domain
MDIMNRKEIEIFCCYAREDQELLLKFKKHLKPLERLGFITVWSDIDINAGAEWENEIKKRLNSSHIILLFVSPDFMQSDYCYSTEMKRAMERHEYGEARVIPIILRPIRWRGAPFGKLQVLPTNAEPVTSRIWHTLDDAFFDVVEGIEKRVEELQMQLLTSVPLPRSSDKFDKFTERVRKVLSLAREEAQRFQHNYIGTEHLLLGLVREGEGVAAKVLANLGVEPNKVRSAVEFIIGRGDRIVLGEIGLTPRAKKVIELAVDEARRLNHHYIGTEHLLLGLVREGEGIAAGVLESLGVNLEMVRIQTIQVLNRPIY